MPKTRSSRRGPGWLLLSLPVLMIGGMLAAAAGLGRQQRREAQALAAAKSRGYGYYHPG